MTADVVRKWLIQVLGRTAAIRTILGSPVKVTVSGQTIPAEAGVYVSMSDDVRLERFADEVVLTVHACAFEATESQSTAKAAALADAIETALTKVSGGAKVWTPTPASAGLRLKSIIRRSYDSPSKIDTTSTAVAASITYSVRGSPIARAP